MMRACSWGPQFREDGSTVFRLWAPAESTLALEIDGRQVAMDRQDDGWFAVRLDNQPVGALYGFVLSDGRRVPDPASRFQPLGVDGPSLLCGPDRFAWKQTGWRGRPWEEAVFYELHIGTFTRDGTYDSAIEHLPRLAEMGFTAIELMPIAQFPGRWGWGYDGVFQFAPHNAYGTPDNLKRLVDAAHQCGLMVFLDVVYNHFGPEGNLLPHYAPGFFHSEDPTPYTELFVDWRLNGGLLQLRANASDEPCAVGADVGDLVYASGPNVKRAVIPAWSTHLFVRPLGFFADGAGS